MGISTIANPKFDELEIKASGTVVVDALTGPDSTTTTVAHGLGFVPVALVYITNPAVGHFLLPSLITGAGFNSGGTDYLGFVGQYYAYADDQNLYIHGQLTDSEMPELTAQYYLLAQRSD